MGETEKADRGLRPDWWVVDVGNTHIKIAAFAGGWPASVFVRPTSWPPTISDLPLPDKRLRAAVASVNPAALPAALEFLGLADADLRVILQSDGAIFRSGFVSTDVLTPDTTGVDRVLGCLGALLDMPHRTVVVVDCGTATTVNVMGPDMCFRGGMIAPGRRLLAGALHRRTAALPEAEPGTAKIGVGKSTRESLEAGVSAAFLGGIRECVNVAVREHPQAAVFLTGGDAAFAWAALPESKQADWLTLRGLHWYATKVVGAS